MWQGRKGNLQERTCGKCQDAGLQKEDVLGVRAIETGPAWDVSS